MSLTENQRDILDHSQHRAANNLFCGDSVDMQKLVAVGFMQPMGKKSFCPDEFFRITTLGRKALEKY